MDKTVREFLNKKQAERKKLHAQRKHPRKYGRAEEAPEYWKKDKKGRLITKGGWLTTDTKLGHGRSWSRKFFHLARKLGSVKKAEEQLKREAKLQKAEAKAREKQRKLGTTIERWRKSLQRGAQRGQ